MPRINVNGVTLAYEVLGDGSPIVWTPGAWFPRDNWVYLNAGCLASRHQVLLWDRRNCGASDVWLEDAPTELHLWTDDLHHLLQALNLSPAYLAGASKGCVFSLLMAHRYPDDVRGLILIDAPTDDPALLRPFADARYYNLANVAATRGMSAALAHSTEAWSRIITGTSALDAFDWFTKWMAETSAANQGNRERLLAMNPQHFATLLTRWGDVEVSSRSHVGWLTDAELGQITAPALVVPGLDALHPRHAAEALQRLLPAAKWVEFADHYAPTTLERLAASDTLSTEKAILTMPIIKQFLQQNEAV